ncbi:MAG: metallophosphoesterase family protein [Dehalococcoidales bacterium]|nr:metallophosphoesterase family protein [Dehalococcoidales bacterium]
MRIGLISDTHVREPGHRAGLSTLTAEVLPIQVRDAFQGVDLILHAGDVYTLPVLDKLETVAPVLVSEGDDDPFEVVNDPRVKHEQFLTIEGITIWVSHYGRLAENFIGDLPDVIVFGHSHKSVIGHRDGALWINPGSPTFPGYEHIAGSVAILTIKDGKVDARLIQLEGDIDGGGTSGLPGKGQ